MGHSGAWAAPGEATAEEKYRALQNAGATMVEHPERFGNVMKDLLRKTGKDVGKIVSMAMALQSFNRQLTFYSNNQLPRISAVDCTLCVE